MLVWANGILVFQVVHYERIGLVGARKARGEGPDFIESPA